MPLFGRSKSRPREQVFAPEPPRYSSHYVRTPVSTGVPEIKERRKRALSHSTPFVAPVGYSPESGAVVYVPLDQLHPQQKAQLQMAGHLPQMIPGPGYHFAGGHVVRHYPPKSGYDTSPQSYHLDSQLRGRPRSNTSTASREKVLLNTPSPFTGLGPAPTSHEGQKSGGIFGSLVNAVRSRSKSRERGALLSSGRPDPQLLSRSSHGDSRGRTMYDVQRQNQMLRDVDAEIARRLEKDLRLQDLEDPYRPLRRDRSRSFDSTRSREHRNRDIDPDVLDNTRYNASALNYPPPLTRMRSDHHSSGYNTDAPVLRRSSTTTAHSKAAHSSHAPPLKGWFNSRGDQLVGHNTVIRMPKDREYQPCYAHYPLPGQGFADAKGNVIDVDGRILKRVG